MRKQVKSCTVAQLRASYPQIDFPEYQREPNLWSLVEKQRLIDSMTRRFDIASLYLYQHIGGSIDCVDGRQRIGTIMSFLGENKTDENVNFRFIPLNEIYHEETPTFESLKDKTFDEITKLAENGDDSTARQFVEEFLDYPLTVVMLSDSAAAEEFNLQFTRLNLGTIINSGEKLHAMVGDLRDECFSGIGTHAFLKETNIPTRRFAREQVAAQILAQVLSITETGGFARTRHFDLQRVFKLHSRFNQQQRELMDQMSSLFDVLSEAFEDIDSLRNRAITVSTVLLSWKLDVATRDEASSVAAFIGEFLARLSWQVGKGLLVDREYHYLTDFQRNITQASAERSSVAARASMLEQEFERWQSSGELYGDAEYQARTGLDPREESRRQEA